MSIAFSAGTDMVLLSSLPTALDDLAVATIGAWVYWNDSSAAGENIYSKGINFAQHALSIETSNAVRIAYARNTPSCAAEAAGANFAAFGANKWLFIVGQNDTGTAGNNKLWVGDLTTLAAEPSAYTTQTVGSGTHNSNVAVAPTIGNRSTGSRQFVGRIASVFVIGSILTQTQIWQMQFFPFNQKMALNIHLFATTWVTDYSGNLFNPTVAVGANANHVPLRPLFGADNYGFTFHTAAAFIPLVGDGGLGGMRLAGHGGLV